MNSAPGQQESTKPISIGVLLVDGFSADSLSIMLETFSIANQLSEKTLYRPVLYSSIGGPLKSKQGLIVETKELQVASNIDCLIVGESLRNQYFEDQRIFNILQKNFSSNGYVGSVGSGAFILARANLLDDTQIVVNNSDQIVLQAQFPELHYSSNRYLIGPRLMSCAGGISTIDMILAWLKKYHSQAFVLSICQLLNYLPISPEHNQLYFNSTIENVDPPKLFRVLEIMHQHIESPLLLSEIAEQVHISLRQMQRLFQNYMDTTPGKYYQQFRLKFAQQLLISSDRKIIDICLATGFESQAHFSTRYKEYFGLSPGLQRKTFNKLKGTFPR